MDKALLAKIRKCLALASSSNENEAAAALSKARALMVEHGVTDEMLAMAEVEESTARASRTIKPPRWESFLANAVERRLKAARAEYIQGHLRRCKPGRKRQRADIFCEAWASAVLVKIAALLPQAPKDELVGQYLVLHYPGLVPVSSRQAAMKGKGVWDDYWRGRDAGRAVDLNQGVGTGLAPAQIA